MFRILNRYLISILVGVAIFYFSTTTSNVPRLPSFSGADKVAHVLMYLALAFSLSMENPQVNRIRRFLVVFLLLVVLGGVIEILQECFFPPRSGDWLDWLADALGAALGVLLASRLCSCSVFSVKFSAVDGQ